jgi:hypothetical protein
MVNIFWPPALPQSPQESYQETNGVLVLRTPTDNGPAKTRRLGKRTNTMSVSFYMSKDQVDVLDDFVENVIMGTKRFGFRHPRKGIISEVRIVPQQDGQMYSLSYITLDWYNVGLEFEVLP